MVPETTEPACALDTFCTAPKTSAWHSPKRRLSTSEPHTCIYRLREGQSSGHKPGTALKSLEHLRTSHMILQAAGKAKKAHLLQTQPFNETFGQKGQRKRPRLSAESYSELLNMAEKTSDE